MVSKLGNNLQHEFAVLTGQLDPPHQYVPWIVLNGVHTEKIQDEAETDLVGLICKTYQVII
jgi:interferon gamma-inducible protein 30